MFRTHFLSKDTEKVKQYKIYNNKLNKIKELLLREITMHLNLIYTSKT